MWESFLSFVVLHTSTGCHSDTRPIIAYVVIFLISYVHKGHLHVEKELLIKSARDF